MPSVIRRNPITKEFSVIATDRGNRPFDFKEDTAVNNDSSDNCPFCKGHEDQTPPTITGNGEQRTFANKFRAFDIEGSLNKQRHGLFWQMNARGAHEVIVATPRHEGLYALTDDEAFGTLLMCRERIIDLKRAADEEGRPKLEYIFIFGNEGRAAGASKKHGHLQLIGLPIAPKGIWEELQRSKEYWEDENTCLLCDLVRQEVEAKDRVVMENGTFISICAYAARFPFETWILPKTHLPIFEDVNEKTMRALAEVLMDTLRRMEKALRGVAFNLYLHNAPLFDRQYDRLFDFHFEIVPRLSLLAGFELGTRLFINPTLPETAAETLRNIV